MYEDRHYIILSVSEIELVNFMEVLETSENTVRKSVDGTKTIVKWDGDGIPTSLGSLLTKEGPYTYIEILDMLSTEEWNKQPPII